MTDEQAPAPAPFTRQDLFSFLGALGALLTLRYRDDVLLRLAPR